MSNDNLMHGGAYLPPISSGEDSRLMLNTSFNTEVRISSSIAGCASLRTRYTPAWAHGRAWPAPFTVYRYPLVLYALHA